MEIIVEKVNGKSDTISSYIKKNQLSNELEKRAFQDAHNEELIDTSATSFIAKIQERIVGVVSFKTATLNFKKYFKVSVFLADSDKVASELTKALLDAYKSSSTHFILTPFLESSNPIVKTLTGFKKYNTIYGKISPQGSISNNVTFLRFTKNNKSLYKRALTNLLSDFDLRLNKEINDSVNEPILSSSIDKAARIRISYFIDGVLKNTHWYLYLVFDVDDEDQEEPIGFVKGLIQPNKSCFIETQIDKDHKKYLDTSIAYFVKNSPAQYYFALSSKANKFETSTLTSVFGKEIGSSYFYS
jgi:hypothetical protein